MALKDIGGGFQMADLSSLPSQLLQLRQLRAQESNTALEKEMLPYKLQKLDLEQKKLEQEVPKLQAEGFQAQQKLMQDVTDSAITKVLRGDLAGGNALLSQFQVPFQALSVDPKKGLIRAKSLVDNSEFDFDWYAQKKVEQNIALQGKTQEAGIEIAKKKTEYITSRANKLIEDRVVSTPQEAQGIAAQEFDNAAQMSGQRIQGYAQSAQQQISELPMKPALQNDLRPREKLSEAQVGKLTGIKTMNDMFLKEILPKYIELEKRLPPNLKNATIEKIRRELGDADPEFTFLSTMVGKSLFEQIRQTSGAAFPEAELKRYERLYPAEKDNLKTNIGKMVALTTMGASELDDGLNSLDASGRDVSGLRKQWNAETGDSPVRTRLFLDALPPEIKSNKEVMKEILSVMPESMRESLKQEVIRRAGGQNGGQQ